MLSGAPPLPRRDGRQRPRSGSMVNDHLHKTSSSSAFNIAPSSIAALAPALPSSSCSFAFVAFPPFLIRAKARCHSRRGHSLPADTTPSTLIVTWYSLPFLYPRPPIRPPDTQQLLTSTLQTRGHLSGSPSLRTAALRITAAMLRSRASVTSISSSGYEQLDRAN